MFYAKINDEDVVTSVVQTHSKIDASDMVEIQKLDRTLLFKKFNRVSNSFETPASLKIKKTVYSRTEFVSLLPKAKVRRIQTLALTNDNINVWLFNLKMSDKIDLNDLEAWFTDGISAMVTEEVFTQAQVDKFLER